jgi:hypothetical protein
MSVARLRRIRTIRTTVESALGMLTKDGITGLWDEYPELRVRLLKFLRLGRPKMKATSRAAREAALWRRRLESDLESSRVGLKDAQRGRSHTDAAGIHAPRRRMEPALVGGPAQPTPPELALGGMGDGAAAAVEEAMEESARAVHMLKLRVDLMEENQSRQLADLSSTLRRMRLDSDASKSKMEMMLRTMSDMGSKLDTFFKLSRVATATRDHSRRVNFEM